METATVKPQSSSPEQRLIDMTSESFVTRLRRYLMLPNLELEISIKGIPKDKIELMAKFIEDCEVKQRNVLPFVGGGNKKESFIRNPFSGNGFTITEISE